MRGRFVNLTGTRVGRLVVIGRAENNRHGSTQWNVTCDCGASRVMLGSTLTRADTVSCGCYRAALNPALRHGHTRSDGNHSGTYRSWAALRGRLSTERVADTYGRLDMDPRWADFVAFLSDMGERPRGGTIERKDNARGYWPDNCVWASKAEQNRNKGDTVRVTIDGETKCLAEWIRHHGANAPAVYRRVRRGWDPLRALTEPTRRKAA